MPSKKKTKKSKNVSKLQTNKGTLKSNKSLPKQKSDGVAENSSPTNNTKTQKNKKQKSKKAAASKVVNTNSKTSVKQNTSKTKKTAQKDTVVSASSKRRLDANMVQLDKFENPEYNSEYTSKIKNKLGFRRVNFYDLAQPNVFTFKDKPRLGGLPGTRHLIKSEYDKFMGKIYTMLSTTRRFRVLMGSKLNSLFHGLSKRSYGIGKLNFIPFSKKDFLISYLSILKGKKEKYVQLFHLTFHKSSAFSQAHIGKKEGKPVFSNTGSIHIVADDPIISAIDGLSVSNSGQNSMGMSLYEIDDTKAIYNEEMKIEKGELVARIQLGIVNENDKSYLQVISFNYSPKLNDVFYKEILKLVHAFNIFVLSTPFHLGENIDIQDLSLTRDDWVVHEKETKSSEIYAAGNELMDFYKSIMKKHNMSISEFMDIIRVNRNVDDYNSDVEYYNARSSIESDNNDSIHEYSSPLHE